MGTLSPFFFKKGSNFSKDFSNLTKVDPSIKSMVWLFFYIYKDLFQRVHKYPIIYNVLYI